MDPKHDNHTSPRPEGDCDCSLDVGRGCSFCRRGGETSAEVCTGCYKLGSTNWLEGMPEVFPDDIFEVRFKNTRKSFYRNVNNLPLKTGDIVAVEASPGHDIGIVSLTGDLVARQMKRVGFNPLNGEFKKIYRKAKPGDIEKWQEAIALEHTTMIRSRQIAAELGLNMKIGDVEYQGDKIKAIFYYIADERVDFRELIKIFAEQFRIRIEMKQIGARPGGRTHRRAGVVRPRTVLCIVDFELRLGNDQRGTPPGDLAQPAETGRAVRQTEVLPRVRTGHLPRRPQGFSARARTAADTRRRILPGQDRHPEPHDVVQQRSARHWAACSR